MLQVRLINQFGLDLSYTAQVLSFDWTMTGASQSGLPDGVPTLNASIGIALNEIGIYNVFNQTTGGRIEVSVPDSDGLTLSMLIDNVTVLRSANKAQITCSADLPSLLTSLKGILLVSADTLSAHNLQVENHEGSFYARANVRTKEDLLLAVLWSYNNLKAITLTPVTTGDEKFQSNGLGIFADALPAQNDANAPSYLVEPRHIIDFNIMPSQPVKTVVESSGFGNFTPQPAISEIDASQIVLTSSEDNIRLLYVKGTTEFAVYACLREGQGSIISQKIYWSDGYVTDMNSTTWQPVVGIAAGHYFVHKLTDYRVDVYERETNTVVKQISVPSGALYFEGNYIYKADFLPAKKLSLGVIQPSAYVIWISTVMFDSGSGSADRYVALWFDGIDGGALAIPNITSWLLGAAKFVKSNVTRAPSAAIIADKEKDYIDGIYSLSTDEGQLIVVRIARNSNGSFAINRIYDTVGLERTYFTGDFAEVYGSSEIIDGEVMEQGGVFEGVSVPSILRIVTPAQKYASPEAEEPESEGFVLLHVSLEDNGTRVTRPLYYFANATAIEIINDFNKKAPTDKITDSTLFYLVQYGFKWDLYSISVDGSYVATVTRIDGEEERSWLRGSTNFLITDVVTAWGEVVSEQRVRISAQACSVPFIMHSDVRLQHKRILSYGVENSLKLDGVVGAIATDARNNNDYGRIELVIKGFGVRDNATESYTDVDIANLHVMAIGSYIKLSLNTTGTPTYVYVKVLTYSLSYRGGMAARVTGMIVQR